VRRACRSWLALVLLLGWAALAAAEAQRYEEIGAPGVVVRFQPEDRRLAATVLEVMTETLEVYRSSGLTDLPAPTSVFVCPSLEECDRLAPGTTPLPRWASAVAFPLSDTILIKRPGLPGGTRDLRRTLIHELSHLMFLRRLKHGVHDVPHWLEEGVAMLRSGHFDWDDHIRLARAALLGGWIPLSALHAGFPADEAGAQLAYLQSVSAVRHLIAEHGQGALELLFRRLEAGASIDAALEAAIGTDLAGFEEEWISRYRARELLLPLLVGGMGVWSLASVLLLAGYVRKAARSRRTLRRWEEEEAAEDAARLARPEE
jgi:hypothetical protein